MGSEMCIRDSFCGFCFVVEGAISCLNKAVTIFTEIGRHIMAAKYSKVLFVVEYTHRD